MIPNPYDSLFVVFEGPDGCGKSSVLTEISSWLKSQDLPVRLTKEPDKKGVWGERIYADLMNPDGLHKRDPFGFQTWYACDSVMNMQFNVIPALKEGKVVLQDRYRHSLCYGVRRDPAADIKEVQQDIWRYLQMNIGIIGNHFLWPDISLIIDVPPGTSIQRLREKGRPLDGHEQIEVLKGLRRNYRVFVDMFPNCHLVDGKMPFGKVVEECKQLISYVLEIKGRNKNS